MTSPLSSFPLRGEGNREAWEAPFAQWNRGYHLPFLGTNQFPALLRNQQGGSVPNN